jgi:hypothetical protein
MQTAISYGNKFRGRIRSPGFQILADSGGSIAALIGFNKRRA